MESGKALPASEGEQEEELEKNDVREGRTECGDICTRLVEGNCKCLDDAYFTLAYINPEFLELLGYTEDEIRRDLKGRYIELIYEPDRKTVSSQYEKNKCCESMIESEYRVRTKEGKLLWILDKSVRIKEADGKKYFYCIMLDITNIKQVQEELRLSLERNQVTMQMLKEQAEKDVLTKLYNRKAARERIEHYLCQKYGKETGAMLIIDIDNFKTVNDRYGHLFGDTVLTKIADRIAGLFRDIDIIARIGGDEFMVFMQRVGNKRIVKKRANEMVQSIKQMMKAELGEGNDVSCSVGVSFFPEQGTDFEELFRLSDLALYEAKKSGKNGYVVYHGKR